MAEIKNFFSRIKLVYRRSSNLTKLIVLVAIVLSTAALITLRLSTEDIRSETRDLQAQAAALEQANSDLEADMEDVGSVQSVAEIAQEELGLVDPDTIVIKPEP